MKATYNHILNDTLLSSAFRYIVLNNTSNNAPYHHFHHMMVVTKWCIEGISNSFGGESKSWPVNEVNELIIAAMFHDMNHSEGVNSDEDNVNEAVNAFHHWRQYWCHDSNIDKYAVEEIIRATQYPYVIESKDLSISQRIIRDADLMIVLEDDWFSNMILGLQKELNIIDVLKMIEGQIAFHRSVKMETNYGQKLYNEKWDEHVFEPLNKLKTIFE